MRRRHIRLIAAKELLDTLRDRRTLFIALVLPLLLYPALLLGLTQIIGVTQRNLDRDHQKVLVDGADAELTELLRGERLEPVDALGTDAELRARIHLGLEELALADLEGEPLEAARGRLRTALNEHRLSGAVVCVREFGERIRGDRQASATLVFDPTDEASKMARGKVARALAEYEKTRREELLRRYPGEAERLRFAQDPVPLRVLETASSSQKGAYSFAPLLGMLIVIMALTGAFYPAVDLAAGEKERGTLETLLVAPVTRREIVLGKFTAVWTIAVVTALLNLLVMGLTFSKLAGMVGGSPIAFDLPWSAMLAVVVILIPTTALFSAIALALSSFATSYKEGQHYMSPLFLVATPLAMVALLPNVQIGYTLALVPVANVVLLVKAMLLGAEATGPALVAILAMVLYAAAALGVAVAIFRRESVLFRTGAGKGYDPVSLRAQRQGLPAEGMGVLLFFAVLALMFFLSSKVESVQQAVRAVLMAQLLAVLAPTLFFAFRAKVNLKRTFAVRTVRPWAVPVLIVSAAATLIVVLALYQWFMPRRDPQGFEHLVQLLDAIPRWLRFGLLAVLAPICEELLCRGFLLSSFRPRFGAVKAVVLSAAFFGALHLDLYRFPATFLAGLMLGYVCVRTGSVFAAILFHMVYNAIVATDELAIFLIEPSAWLVGGAAVALAGSVVLLRRLGPPAEIDSG